MMAIPVLAIDGPSGSGKGAVSQRIAAELDWHFLDSGALYRALAVAATRGGMDVGNADRLAQLARALDLRFGPDGRVRLGQDDITDAIRTEQCGNTASQVAAFPAVRKALLQKQHDMRQPPGLVADGRDMGTTVFPDAVLKVFLTASPEVRADRRYKQLKEKGLDVNLPRLLGEIRERDVRDAERVVSPLRPADGAYVLDTSALAIDEVVALILERLHARLRH